VASGWAGALLAWACLRELLERAAVERGRELGRGGEQAAREIKKSGGVLTAALGGVWPAGRKQGKGYEILDTKFFSFF